MSKVEKLRQRILDGKSDANISFDDLRNFLRNLGFEEGIKGSHHSFRRRELAISQICSVTAVKPNLIKCGKYVKSSKNMVYEK
ncbi:hypothetical protein BH18ACI3_BH18ACI3_13270 [soil metagenome]|jgi:predicted RNA binding protein YcfA (HicA-like mRNA interferase family)